VGLGCAEVNQRDARKRVESDQTNRRSFLDWICVAGEMMTGIEGAEVNQLDARKKVEPNWPK
jgi:hypothetical protein